MIFLKKHALPYPNATIEKVIDKKSELTNVNCDFCDSDKYNLLFHSKDFLFKTTSFEFNIKRCSKCGLVFTNPRLKLVFTTY